MGLMLVARIVYEHLVIPILRHGGFFLPQLFWITVGVEQGRAGQLS
jgi:hypothetical protein